MDENDNALPIACTLQPGELERRKADLLPGLMRQAVSCTAVQDGYRLVLRKETSVADIGQVIDSERRCCQFLRFELVVRPGLGALQLDITGPPGTRDFLASLLEE